MTQPNAIAVLISTYNAPAFLQLALDAWGQQTDMNFRIYIADDGSDDATRQMIDAFRLQSPVPIEHIWHEDQGFRKARIHNRALQRIEEPYVLLSDGDCLPPPRLVETHRRFARPGCFINGGRILLSRSFTQALLSGQEPLPESILDWLGARLRGRVNRLLPWLLPPHCSAPHTRLAGIRGCHLACWRDDLVAVNGFDESYEGWGREDSDLAARLMHAGIRRMDLRGMPVLHLWHPEVSRSRLDDNDAMLRQCLAEKRIRAIQGLAELETGEVTS